MLQLLVVATSSAKIVEEKTMHEHIHLSTEGGQPTCTNTWRRVNTKPQTSREKAHVTHSIHAGAYFLSNSLHSTDKKYTSLTILLHLQLQLGLCHTKRGLLLMKT